MKTFRFQKEDRLFLYTDGVSEITDSGGEMFGTQRLKKRLQEHRGDHQQFLDELFAALRQFNGSAPLEDDCTAIVMDFHRPYSRK